MRGVARLVLVVLVVGAGLIPVLLVGQNAGLSCTTNHYTIVDVELAGSADLSSQALVGCRASDVEDALLWDVPFIAAYVAALVITVLFVSRFGGGTFLNLCVQVAAAELQIGPDIPGNRNVGAGIAADEFRQALRQLAFAGVGESGKQHLGDGESQDAVAEKLQRFRRIRLAQECAKLQPAAERAAAEEYLQGEVAWPEY